MCEIKGGGAAPPENVLPRGKYLEMLGESGLNISSSWYDGWIDVHNPSSAG